MAGASAAGASFYHGWCLCGWCLLLPWLVPLRLMPPSTMADASAADASSCMAGASAADASSTMAGASAADASFFHGHTFLGLLITLPLLIYSTGLSHSGFVAVFVLLFFGAGASSLRSNLRSWPSLLFLAVLPLLSVPSFVHGCRASLP